MPSTELPRALKGFVEHGVRFERATGEDQWVGACPFCRREGHFYANVNTKLWDCKRCRRAGNFRDFLGEVHGRNVKGLRGRALRSLARDRGVNRKTLQIWRVGFDGKQYTIPTWESTAAGLRMLDLRRYELGRRSYSTAGARAGLAGGEQLSDPIRNRESVWIVEGEWDAMAVSEAFRKARRSGIVVGVPGAGIFKPEWADLFRNRKVFVALDHDDAGRDGEQKIAKTLTGIARRLHFIHWTPSLPDGFDVRDLYIQIGRKGNEFYKTLLRMAKEKPRPGPAGESTAEKDAQDDLTGEGLAANIVLRRYREWLHLPRREVLDIIFGTLFANRIEGDPLWLFVVARSGETKTELLMALEESPLIVTTSALTTHALISGSQEKDGTDPSLLAKLDKNVLVVKDFTTVLEMNPLGREEVFSTLRDAYDGKAEKSFGHGIGTRTYRSRFGMIAGVTPVVHMYATLHGSLGERFLKYRIPGPKSTADEVDLIKRAIANIAHEVQMREELCAVAAETLDRPITQDDVPEIPEEIASKTIGLARWVGLLRGAVRKERYTGTLQHVPFGEVATRLAKQLVKLGMGIAIYHRQRIVTPDIYRTLVHVARATVPDRVERIVATLFVHSDSPEDYMPAKAISAWARFPEQTTRSLLEDLQMLGVVEAASDIRNLRIWRLAPIVVDLIRPLSLYTRPRATPGRIR